VIGKKSLLTRRLMTWYALHRRDLPWRVAPGAPPKARPDPYHVLVSEAMLQQTQVVTVIPYFQRFVKKYPSIRSLAEADEQDVLRAWQGLGYYSRARNLRAAAKAVVNVFGGRIPDEVKHLLQLPGVGRYTAGAIASLAFGRSVPIVDGNVSRVLCRLERIESDPRQRQTLERLWMMAESLLPDGNAAHFNSGLMELGATVCTPRGPGCTRCPIRPHCESFAAGVQGVIPLPRRSKPTPLLRRRTLCIGRENGRGPEWLIEQRPSSGRWAGMWQFITRPTRSPAPDLAITRPVKLATVSHGLTHRRYHFDVYLCRATGSATPGGSGLGRWVHLDDLHRYPLPRPHLKIADLLRTTVLTPPTRRRGRGL
jgi:A/G-specific adenine glycosylase